MADQNKDKRQNEAGFEEGQTQRDNKGVEAQGSDMGNTQGNTQNAPSGKSDQRPAQGSDQKQTEGKPDAQKNVQPIQDEKRPSGSKEDSDSKKLDDREKRPA